MKDIRILEVTKENENRYLQKISDLEVKVLEHMEKQGKTGQLFITGKEDISAYVNSNNNTVMAAVDKNDDVIAATYITQGQNMFTYNDITKYFKASPEYEEYIKSQYNNEMDYKKDVLQAYETKINAYLYAREKVLSEYSKYSNINEFLEAELQSEGHFDEKSELREKIISYMSEYIENKAIEDGDKVNKQYEKFFWMTADDVFKIIYGKDVKNNKKMNDVIIESENLLQTEREHQQVFENARLKIYEEPDFDQQKYFEANTKNSIEIDTYITDPNNRSQGLARELVFEGIKKHLENNEKEMNTEDVFLCSTLHRENVSSKYVSEFFGLKDSLFVNRRQGRDREVHITGIKRKDIGEYLTKISEKLAVLYGYNREKMDISKEREEEILKEQLKYEKTEYKRLNKIRHSSGKYKGTIKNMISKSAKIEKIKNRISTLRKSEDERNEGDER